MLPQATKGSNTVKELGKAFSFPFKDPDWVTKFLIAVLFMFLCLIGIGFFVLAGYFIQVTQRVMRREQNLMPDWSHIGIKFVIGFKFVVVYLLYLLPVFLLLAPVWVLAILSAASDQPEVAGIVAMVYVFGAILLIVPYSLALAVLMPIIAYRYAEHERISEALDIGTVLAHFKINWQNTVIVALIVIGIESFAAIGIIAFIVGVFFTLFYSYLVSAYLHGALYLSVSHDGSNM